MPVEDTEDEYLDDDVPSDGRDDTDPFVPLLEDDGHRH